MSSYPRWEWLSFAPGYYVICEGLKSVAETETIDNAHLIAAAPELLEVLVSIKEELDRLAKHHPQWPTSPLRDQTIAAIAKATGEP